MNNKTTEKIVDLICKKNGEISIFGERTLSIISLLGKFKTWHFMESKGFAKSLKHNSHYDDVIELLTLLNISYSIKNDAPRGGIGGDHIALNRRNNNIKERIINIISKDRKNA